MESIKELNYYKNNCKEDYIKTPISVLRYITELEQALQLQQTGVVRSCSHENYTNYCNTDGSYSHKLCDDCFEILD
jgi:hypothetical protein